MTGKNTFLQDPVAAAYYQEGFLRELVERRGLKKKAEPTNNAATFASYYGAGKFPPELDQFLRMRDEYEFVYHALGEWRLWGDDTWLPDPAKGNLAEQVIRLDQGNYLGTCMHEYATGCIYLGTAGNGDVYLASPDPETGNAEVVFWDHETNDMKQQAQPAISSTGRSGSITCCAATKCIG